MSFLDTLLLAYRNVAIGGVRVPQQPVLNFVSGATAVNNPGNGSTDITISGGGGGFTAGGDLSGTSTDQTVIGIRGVSVPNPSGSNTTLIYNAGAFTWGASTGLSQLTQDVLAGPGTGSQPATVVGLQTYPISSAAPSQGTVLFYGPDGETVDWHAIFLSGDITGHANNLVVTGLQTYQISTTPPTSNQVLQWNSGTSLWTPTTIGTVFTAGGDLSGSNTNQTVIGLQTHAVSATAPTNGQALVYATSGTHWEPVSPAGDVQGSFLSFVVVALQGYSVSNTAPTNGQALVYSTGTSKWTPTTLSGSFAAGGDLSGSSTDQTVIGIQTYAVSSTAPTNGQALVYNTSTSMWTPTTLSGSFSAGGDLSGSSTDQTVIGLQTHPVSNTAPTNGQALVYVTDATKWEPLSPNGDLGGTYLVTEVIGLLSNALPSLTAGYLEWTGSAWAFGSGGGGVVWADDLASSSSTAQWVSGISGTNGGSGIVTLGNGTSSLVLQMVASGQTVPPTLEIQGAAGYAAASAAGAGGSIAILGGDATDAISGTAAGAAGGGFQFIGGYGGDGIGTNQNSGSGGSFQIITGNPGSPTGSGTSGYNGILVVSLGYTTGEFDIRILNPLLIADFEETTVDTYTWSLADGVNNTAMVMTASAYEDAPVWTLTGSLGYTPSESVGYAGGAIEIIGGAGGPGNGDNHTGGTGAEVLIAGGAGGAATGTAANSNGGNVVITPGAAGTGGSGAAGTVGSLKVTTFGAGVLLSSSSGVITPLADGTNGYVLTMVSGSPAWAAASGGSVTWANDLSSSSSTHQYVSGISGSGGTGGTIALSDGTHTLALAMDTSTSALSPPQLQLNGAGGYTASGTSGIGGAIQIAAGAGAAASGSTHTSGAAGGALNLSSGAGANGIGLGDTANGGAGGGITITCGAGGTPGPTASVTSVAGVGGSFTVTAGAGGEGTQDTTASSAPAGANGGAISLTAGAGGLGGYKSGGSVGNSGGTGGAVTIVGGIGGATSGTSTTPGVGGAITITAGTGGTGCAGATGGAITITAGAGGAAVTTNTQGPGGASVTIAGGAGGASVGTAGNSAGGNVILQTGAAGTGGSGTVGNAGYILFSIGGTEIMWLGDGGLGQGYIAGGVSLTSGTTTLTAAQASYPYIDFAASSLSGANTVVFPAVQPGQSWYVDATDVTFNGHAITLQINSNNMSTTITSAALWRVFYGHGGKFYAVPFSTT